MVETPPWKICIVTTAPTAYDYLSIKNALLYADYTYWVSLEVPIAWWRAMAGLLEALDSGDKSSSKRLEFAEEKFKLAFLEEIRVQLAFLEEIRVGGAASLLKQHCTRDQTEAHFFRMISDFAVKKEPPGIWESILRELDPVLSSAGVVVCRTKLLESQSKYWNARSAAHELMTSLSRVLLPDVSDLPIEAIMDVRSRLQDSLDPMRGEMLRLTEELRQLVGSSTDSAAIAAEADNLIATRVEPVVRDANRRANELLQAKWRKLFTGAAKAFGFAGAGFVDPKLIGKAVQQTLETGALAFGDHEESVPPMGSTSQFVLRARRLAAEHDPE
jgi:hypothetical protein